MTRSQATRAALFVATALATPLGAQTQNGATGQANGDPAPAIIHACYTPITGVIYRIKEVGLRETCFALSNGRYEHIQFSWSTDGSGASQGPPGPAGPQGPQGPAGPQGLPGKDGALGPEGPQGLAGAVGATGATGAAGPQGPAGPPGPQGAQGAQGAQGLPGEKGADGAPGAQGAQGAQGLPGEKGADGAAGAQGVQGPPGVPCNDGCVSTSSLANLAVTDDKLARITQPEKIANSATTATSGNVLNTIVLRDANKGFEAGALTLSGKVDQTSNDGLVARGPLSAITGTTAPATGGGTRMMWYAGKAAFRAGKALSTEWEGLNVGDYSVAMGDGTKANGAQSVALGFRTIASGQVSTAMGNQSEATGFYSTAMGFSTLASGSQSTAMGNQSEATAANTTAMGSGTKATAGNSTAMGSGTTASGVSSTAMGSATMASGQNSTAMGSSTKALNINSTAMGAGTTASGQQSTAMGSGTIASGDHSTAMGTRASTADKTGTFVYGDNASGTVIASADNQFVVRAQHFWLGTTNTVSNPTDEFITTSTGAHLTAGGVWTNSSDVNRKHRFQPADAEATLDRLATLPITTWTYRGEADSVRHLGPTAQDFRAAFGLGQTDTGIGTVDADGVSLLATQALERRTRALAQENGALRAQIADLERRLARLEAASKP
jgi:hypothetical protein